MTGLRVLWAVTAVTIALVAALVQTGATLAQPEITESNIENGDVLDGAPEVIRLCFSEPVDTADRTQVEESDDPSPRWAFNVLTPDGTALGLRIVFQPDGECVDVEPGIGEEPPEGVWTFDWMVRSQETGEENSGVITFRVGAGEPPVIEDDDDDGGNTTLYAVIGGVAAAVVVAGLAAGAVAMRRRSESTDSDTE